MKIRISSKSKSRIKSKIAPHRYPIPDTRYPTPMDRNLALEFVRVTEAAALSASRWVGRGDRNGADQAATWLRRL